MGAGNEEGERSVGWSRAEHSSARIADSGVRASELGMVANAPSLGGRDEPGSGQ